MPPQPALPFTLAFIAFLFLGDHRERPAVTGSLWIPGVEALLPNFSPLGR